MAQHAQSNQTPARADSRPRVLIFALVALLSLLAIGVALAQLLAPARALRAIERQTIDGLPAKVYVPAQPLGPAVVIAHGFAGSQQLMEPFALTLARAGFLAITFDFPGHGQNTTPLSGGLADQPRRDAQLSEALDRVVAYARARADGRVALVGHSMGSAAVVRYAQARPEIGATVAVSLVYNGVTPTSPRNLLAVTGALESGLRPLAQRVADQGAGGAAQPATTYGNFTDGTARRVVFAPNVEHIGVLYSPTSMAETLGWLNAGFELPRLEAPFLDERPAWLGLLYLGVVALFWPVSRLFRPPATDVVRVGHAPPLPRFRWWLTALVPALLAPLLLRVLPVAGLLPIQVGGPLAVLFALYGALTAAGLMVIVRARHAAPLPAARPATHLHPVKIALAVLLYAGYVFLTFGLPAQLFVLNYFPPAPRWWIAAAVFVAMLPYFLADEWLTRRPGAPRGAYAITKVCFLAALALAIVLNRGLSFLTLIAPLFLLYFLIYGWFSGLVYRRTGTPLIGALGNALIFAWSVAAVFPLVA